MQRLPPAAPQCAEVASAGRPRLGNRAWFEWCLRTKLYLRLCTLYKELKPKGWWSPHSQILYHMHCHRNSVLSYTFSPDETTTKIGPRAVRSNTCNSSHL